jgi:ATP-dependent DNA helicase
VFQNNLAELWSLLNFILPEIFDDVAAFQDSYAVCLSILSTSHSKLHRFKIPTLSNGLAESRNTLLIHKLHDILRPFLLRRLKVDVERSLPPKKEYVLYAPLTERQRDVYDAVVKGCLRGLLAGVRPGQDAGCASASGWRARLKKMRSWVGSARARARARPASLPSRSPTSERSISSRPRVRFFTTVD